MAEKIIWGAFLFCLGYTAGIAVARLLAKRIERRRASRTAPRGHGGILVVRAVRAPQAVRREVSDVRH